MSLENIDTDAYILPSSDDESRRLERQARLYGGTSFIDPFLTDEVRKAAELGCGTGFFTRHVAERLPQAHVFGLDIDPKRVEFARKLNQAPNLSMDEGDLTALPFADGELDLVFSRFVLVHYPDPAAALAEMRRVVRPGGTVVTYEMLHSGIWFSPKKPAFEKVLLAAMDAMRAWGMEPDQGLHLPVAMTRAGFEDVSVRVEPFAVMSGDPLFEDYRYNWAETIKGIADILASSFDEALVKRACAELEPSEEPTFLTEIAVLASGRVPRAGSE